MAKKVRRKKPFMQREGVKVAIRVFSKLAQGLVKVWHQNRSFIITKEDAMKLTLEQLEALVNSKQDGR